MNYNGSVSKNVRYQDICVDRFVIAVAYNSEPTLFEIENNLMVDLRVKYQFTQVEKIGYYSFISENDEILSKFFNSYNIIIQWINCNYTWGWFDYETGKWTGAVGQVIIYLNFVCIKINH